MLQAMACLMGRRSLSLDGGLSLYGRGGRGIAVLGLVAGALLFCGKTRAQDGYQKPPKEVLEVMNAPMTPRASLGRARDIVLLYSPEMYPPIADVAQPFARLAGLRIDEATNGPHNAPRFDKLVLKKVSDGSEIKVAVPEGMIVSQPFWAPDGTKIAFTHATDSGIELWIADARTGEARAMTGVKLNAALSNPGPRDENPPCHWLPGSKTMLCQTIPAGRVGPPKAPAVPVGPRVQQSFGKAAPVATYEDLLENEYDGRLFDYYATSQLAVIDIESGSMTPVGAPALFGMADPAPDGTHVLVAQIRRPYSYIVPAEDFPKDVEVWDLSGRVVYKVASLPLQENVPIGGVPTGPRDMEWHPNKPGTVVWVEALDDGDPKKKVKERDKVMWIHEPFAGEPLELARTEKRFAGIAFGERGDFAILRDFDRDTLRGRAWFFNPSPTPEQEWTFHADKPNEKTLVWDLSTQDRYHNPGTPVMWPLSNGHSAVMQQSNFIFLMGAGASPDGERPFLDRLDINTMELKRIFQGEAKSYEEIVAMLSTGGTKLLTRRETPVGAPNYYIRDSSKFNGNFAEPGSLDQVTAFTKFTDPTPALRAIQKQLVTYQRADGVALSMTVYLPPDYKQGERRPAVVWAYPLEFTDASVAGQVSGSPYRFTTIMGPSPLFFLLDGYVVLDGASMPVVGNPETVNNTYIEQITSSAKAAIDKAAEMGVVDPNRVGVGGHSYGAFMTANLLAHSNLFRAGIARSGAYNRTLTPFGFQSERRTLWQAPDLYVKVSPFMFADKIKAPILLIHGEADNNSGTFPIQSDRMYRAIKGNGGAVRYVTLPDEAHGYAARESIEDVVWEMLTWFDKYVKNPGGDQAQAKTSTTK
ncbi:MAG TPA: prolyl oligopeptidase family serine peptidase [Candidatus Cybelea sp.]|nr:prolyl oligopeptidase family serine peptidase [Candidatus Cybelea sp.]